jgi:16S rRNA (cytidine1402-2'-O)-methyltransferase
VSLLLALAASGLNGQSFAFVGYLPQEATERAKRMRELESIALQDRADPAVHRERRIAMKPCCRPCCKPWQPSTRLSVSSGLTLPHAQLLISRPWSRHGAQQADGPDNSTPAVFAIGR